MKLLKKIKISKAPHLLKKIKESQEVWLLLSAVLSITIINNTLAFFFPSQKLIWICLQYIGLVGAVIATHLLRAKKIDKPEKQKENEDASIKKGIHQCLLLRDVLTHQNKAVSDSLMAIQQVSEQIEVNNNSTGKVTQLTEENQKSIKDGNKNLEVLIDSLEQIIQSSREFDTKVNDLLQQMIEMVDKLKLVEKQTEVIDDIVFQTRLLSFNASVEAARAGEHGKGFVVVAEEVRKLAESSSQSAAETKALISSVVEEVDKLTESTKSSLTEAMNKQKAIQSEGQSASSLAKESSQKVVQLSHKINHEANFIGVSLTRQNEYLSEIRDLMNSFCDGNLNSQDSSVFLLQKAIEIFESLKKENQEDDSGKKILKLENKKENKEEPKQEKVETEAAPAVVGLDEF